MDSETDEEEREFDKKSTSGPRRYEKSQIHTQVEPSAALLLHACFSDTHALFPLCLETAVKKNTDTECVNNKDYHHFSSLR